MFYMLNSISGTLRITKKIGKRYGPLLMSVIKDGEQHLVLRTGCTPPMRREWDISQKSWTLLNGTIWFCILARQIFRFDDLYFILAICTWWNKGYVSVHCNIFYNQLLVQRISCKNSRNRQNVKVHHRVGSRTFSQCSFEKVITLEAHDHASLPFEISLICYILA